MALYQDNSFLIQSRHPYFNTRIAPGTIVSVSGIYRCKGCGQEIALAESQALPTQKQHQHRFELGPSSWELIVLVC